MMAGSSALLRYMMSLVYLVLLMLVSPAAQALRAPPPPTPTNDAYEVRETIPTTMVVGTTYTVSITMGNVGNTDWVSGYYLGSMNPTGNTVWGVNRLNINGDVAPQGQWVFTFNVTAPTTPGSYSFAWLLTIAQN